MRKQEQEPKKECEIFPVGRLTKRQALAFAKEIEDPRLKAAVEAGTEITVLDYSSDKKRAFHV